MYEDLNLDESILDLDLKDLQKLVLRLIDVLEVQGKMILELQEEVQRLRDENAILKGGNAKPKFPPSKENSKDVSSEKERKEEKVWKKSSKKENLEIDKKEICPVDKKELPSDAKFVGYEETVVQGIVIRRNNVLYLREKYYSESEHKTYLGKLPEDYMGSFSKEIHGLALSLKFVCNVSEPKILLFMGHIGIKISAGTLSDILIRKHSETFEKEKEEILTAGLESYDYHQTDTTQATVNGKRYQSHILCNEVYTSYTTNESKSRMSTLDVLRQNKPREYIFDDKAFDLMNTLKVSAKSINYLKERVIEKEKLFSESEALDLVKGLKKEDTILECAYISAYRKEKDSVKILVVDDAPQYNLIGEYLALCWIHEGRHYKKLSPLTEINRQKLNKFLDEFWDYYKDLKQYKENPNTEMKEKLEVDFDKLFSRKTGYTDLDERINKTFANKAKLLLVLDFPYIPLHNNESELGAKQQVRYRDVSLQTKNEQGTKAKDALLTVVETAKKLKVSIWDYLLDRVSKKFELKSLADTIREKANPVPNTT